MNKQKILVLAANPQGTDELRLNKEIKAIEEAVWNGIERDRFTVVHKVAVKTSELQSLLRREKPRIVHFSGHGTGKSGLVFHSENDREQLVSSQAIAALFQKYANTVECVVLNACYSIEQAQAINQQINYVVGTIQAIRDDAAIAFSQGFYASLGDGETISSAMEDGCVQIQLDIGSNSNGDRKLIPVDLAEKYLPEKEVLTLLEKEEPNEIVEIDSEKVLSPHDRDSDRAATAFDILRELMEIPLIKTAVIKFKIEFAAISEQLEILATYKDLHDLLHNLEFQCYQGILREARHFPEDFTSMSILESYGQNLQDIIADIESIIAQKNTASAGVTWHQDLTQALNLLQNAIEQEDKRMLQKAIWFINRIIASEPMQINNYLVSTSRVLRLPSLVKAMSSILNKIIDSQLDSSKINKFKDSVTSLSKLDRTLKSFVSSHDSWQRIDVELRRIETVTANTSDLFELEMSWSDLKEEVARQYQDCQESWAVALQKAAERLDLEISTPNSLKVKQCFNYYRNLASQRFNKVDRELRNFCGNLREVGKTLDYLLEMME